MTAQPPVAVTSAQLGAAAHLREGRWQSALTEYYALAKPGPTDNLAGVGLAWALARGGYLDESYLVLDRVLSRYDERLTAMRALSAEAVVTEPDVPIGTMAANAGLLVWRRSQWLDVYLVLMLVLSVLPLVAGLIEENYTSIVFGALSGGALIYLYITRHRVPAWHVWDSPGRSDAHRRAISEARLQNVTRHG